MDTIIVENFASQIANGMAVYDANGDKIGTVQQYDLTTGWFFDVLTRANPIASGLHYVGLVLVTGHAWTKDLGYLVSPVVVLVVATAVLTGWSPRLVRLFPGVRTA